MSGFFIAFLLGVFSLAVPDVVEAKGKRPTREAIEQAEAFSCRGLAALEETRPSCGGYKV